MALSTKETKWFRQLLAAVVKSIGHGISAGLGVIGIDPDHFSLTQAGGLERVLGVIGIVVLFGVVRAVGGFLEENPIPINGNGDKNGNTANTSS